MRLDEGYAKYKFAREATGGIPQWEEAAYHSMPAVILGKNAGSYRFSAEYPGQEFCTIANAWQIASQPLTSAALSDCLIAVRTTTTGTGAAIFSFANVRKAAPIFRASVVSKFARLVDEWKATRNQINSGTEMFMHPAYQKIIGMGSDVVPLILREMEASLDHWFWALKAITGKDPVPPAHRGRLKLMAEDWLTWAKKQGYQW
jgi:hypothetical protein